VKKNLHLNIQQYNLHLFLKLLASTFPLQSLKKIFLQSFVGGTLMELTIFNFSKSFFSLVSMMNFFALKRFNVLKTTRQCFVSIFLPKSLLHFNFEKLLFQFFLCFHVFQHLLFQFFHINCHGLLFVKRKLNSIFNLKTSNRINKILFNFYNHFSFCFFI
jgi:hypothetical protein